MSVSASNSWAASLPDVQLHDVFGLCRRRTCALDPSSACRKCFGRTRPLLPLRRNPLRLPLVVQGRRRLRLRGGRRDACRHEPKGRHEPPRSAAEPGRLSGPGDRRQGRADPQEPGGGGVLHRGAARARRTRGAVPARRHLRGLGLYRHQPRRPRTSTSSARPATTRASCRHFQERGYAIEIEDERWIGKVYKGQHFFDVIFASSNGTMPVSDEWFENARQIEVFGTPVRIVGADRARLVEVLHPAPPPLRRRRRRPRHPEGARADRLAAAARLHGGALGGAADAPPELPLDLPDRARQRPALADGRAARAAAPRSSSCRRRR